MENNDLPDFDADDLIEAMAEECRKGELAGESRSYCVSDPMEAETETAAADGVEDPIDDPLTEIVI